MSGGRPLRHSKTDREQHNRESCDSRTSRSRNESYGSVRKGPAGLIFMCNTNTKRDCFHFKVFGLPMSKRDLVEQVAPGTLLFLFDFDVKQLYGIYEAVSWGGINLEPDAFNGHGSYPAQVKFDVYWECPPLTEDEFKDAIRENYYARNKFKFELSSRQVDELLKLFYPIEPPYKRINLSNEFEPQRQSLLNRNAADLQPHVHYNMYRRLSHEVSPTEERNAMRVAIIPQRPYLSAGIEERVPMHVPHLQTREEPHLQGDMIAKSHLPPIKAFSDHAQTGLLNQRYMNEVDELALKYLNQRDPSSLDPYPRNCVVPFPEAAVSEVGLTSRLRQEARLIARHDIAQEDAIRMAQKDAICRAQEDAIHRAQEDAIHRAQEDAILRGQEDAILRAHHEARMSNRTLDSERLPIAASRRVIFRHAAATFPNLSASSLQHTRRMADVHRSSHQRK